MGIKKKILTGLAALVIVGSPQEAQAIEKLNPWIQPYPTTNYYGSADINLDGKVDNEDRDFVQSAISNGTINLTFPQSKEQINEFHRADVNYDSKLDQNDLNEIQNNIYFNTPLTSDPMSNDSSPEANLHRENLFNKTTKIIAENFGIAGASDCWDVLAMALYPAREILNQNFGKVNIGISDGPNHGMNYFITGSDLRDPSSVKFYDHALKKEVTPLTVPNYFPSSTTHIQLTGNYPDTTISKWEDYVIPAFFLAQYDNINQKLVFSEFEGAGYRLISLKRKDIPTSIEERLINELPQGYYLSQNYPNPFNPTTTIEFEIPTKSDMQINIYNIKGQKIKTLANELYSAGKHEVSWDGKNSTGENVASGIYLYQTIIDNKYSTSKKMLLLK